MNLENTGLSRRKLLRTAAIGVPAAGAVAMGATLVAAPASNAAMIAADGYWGTETTRMLQTLFKLDVVDGIVSSQPASRRVLTPGWQAAGTGFLMLLLTAHKPFVPFRACSK